MIFFEISHDGGVVVMEKPTMNEIQNDLLDQLERNGTSGKYYIDLVDDYMSLWRTKNMLVDDIMERGATVGYKNGENQYGTKKNESIDQVLKVSQQMIKILDALGIKPTQGGEGDGDEM
jgi:serine phosphatase RsbU (regulator of sigma subunit)